MKRRWLTALLAASLAFGGSVSVLAAETDGGAVGNGEIVAAETFSEVDANGLTWRLENGVLTISGNGMIEENPVSVDLKDEVTSVVILEGVTGIGKEAFAYYHQLEHISIPDMFGISISS